MNAIEMQVQAQQDQLIKDILSGRLNKGNITMQLIRDVYKSQYIGGWESLERGRAILNDVMQLNQYLHSYGRMVNAQWCYILDKISLPTQAFDLFDYGSGQGLACLKLHDQFAHRGMLGNVRNINLIEPSLVAIQRAAQVVGCCFPNANIATFNTDLDSVAVNTFERDDAAVSVHLFSNILDIESFDENKLISRILAAPGEHRLIAVSNNRGCEGGPRVPALYKRLKSGEIDANYKVKDHAHTSFVDSSNMSSYIFRVTVEV